MKAKSVHKENSKAWWDEKYTSSGNSFFYDKAPSNFLLQNIELIPKGAKILDVACGEGRNAVALASMGHKVTAIDFSAVALERAKSLARESGVEVTFKSTDLDMYLPELMAFDVILSVDFKPAKTFISNVSRGLAQHGFFLMEAFLMAGAKAYDSIEAFECFTPNELIRQFVPSQASFKILNYSELGPAKWGEKVFLVAQKAQLF
ncbi:MAG: ribosomal protein methyltransferase-like protein [Bacteriovoracaceae bacterium]|nr:ribosomal protein methyltransferase-like protein [Bacteriovoracaceae bacterium]